MNSTSASAIEPLLIEEQTRIASMIHLATAPLSILGSGSIIYSIWRERRKKMQRVYQRLMLGLSVMDLISSLALVLTMPWLAPAELGNELVFGAYGTFTSCTISAFFYNFMIGASCYSVCLSLFFVTQVRLEMREEKFAKCLEPASHAISILIPVASGVLAAIGGHLNPVTAMPGLCFIQEYPSGCAENEDIECIRGAGADASNKIFGGTVGISFLTIIVCMLLILCKVAATERRIGQYGQGTQRNMIRTKQTGRQALMYIGAYFSWFFPFTIAVLLQRKAEYGDTKYFIALLGLRTISPLQGFFNALIYRKRMGGAERTRTSVSRTSASKSFKFRPSKMFSSKLSSDDNFAISDRSSGGLQQRSDHSTSLQESHPGDKDGEEDN